MAIFFIILKQELLLSLRNLAKIFSVFLFFLISFFVFHLIASGQENQGLDAVQSITIIWFSLLSCLVFSSAEFLQKDFKDGTIEQLLIACENFEIVVLAKMLASWLVYCLPILFFSFLLLFVGDFSAKFLLNFLISLALASLAISFICSFCGSLSVLENSASMIAVIALPLIVPVLLIAYKIPASSTSYLTDFQPNFALLGGIVVLACSLSVLATTKIIKIAAE